MSNVRVEPPSRPPLEPLKCPCRALATTVPWRTGHEWDPTVKAFRLSGGSRGLFKDETLTTDQSDAGRAVIFSRRTSKKARSRARVAGRTHQLDDGAPEQHLLVLAERFDEAVALFLHQPQPPAQGPVLVHLPSRPRGPVRPIRRFVFFPFWGLRRVQDDALVRSLRFSDTRARQERVPLFGRRRTHRLIVVNHRRLQLAVDGVVVIVAGVLKVVHSRADDQGKQLDAGQATKRANGIRK
eukprot:4014833-Pyramimonas_sp.AAC.2